MTKVSVIIPVYNTEKYLERCLDSLILQTLRDIEIICVNDGSTDGSLEILTDYSEKDDRIIIINQVNSGMSVARNVGIDNAKGEYIGFVDSDDFVEYGFYEKLYNSAKEEGADIACASIVRENEQKKKVLIEYNSKIVCEDVKSKFENAKLPSCCFVWNKIYRRESLLNSGVKFPIGMIYEDMVFTPNVLIEMDKMVTVPDVFYHYWKSRKSAIKIDTDKSRANKLEAKKYLLEVCRKNNICLTAKDSLERKTDYSFLGIKLFKVYEYRTFKEYYLFGLIPFMTIKEYV